MNSKVGNKNYVGIKVNTAEAQNQNLSRADLSDTSFICGDFIGSVFMGAKLCRAHFEWATLRYVNMEQADLSFGFFCNADMTGVNLSGANLTGADFSGANLSGANLNGAILDGAVFSNTDLDSVSVLGVSLINADLSGAKNFCEV